MVQVDSLSNRTVFPPDTDYMLLREELVDPGSRPGVRQGPGRGRRGWRLAETMSVERHIYEDAPAAAEACAQYILGILKDALAARRQATLALSGGSTPKLLFESMAAAKFKWDGVHLFWVDERPVPPG